VICKDGGRAEPARAQQRHLKRIIRFALAMDLVIGILHADIKL
jgi:hypothetical protein